MSSGLIGLGIWVAGLVTGAAGGVALGYILGRGQRRERPIEIGRPR